jgi:hypothetical protein
MRELDIIICNYCDLSNMLTFPFDLIGKLTDITSETQGYALCFHDFEKTKYQDGKTHCNVCYNEIKVKMHRTHTFSSIMIDEQTLIR